MRALFLQVSHKVQLLWLLWKLWPYYLAFHSEHTQQLSRKTYLRNSLLHGGVKNTWAVTLSSPVASLEALALLPCISF